MQLTKSDKEVINSLKSDNRKIVISTIQQFREKGNTNLITYVLDLLLATSDNEVKLMIVALLNDLKEQSAVSSIVSAIKDSKYQEILPILLSSCWQSGLNYSDHYEFFTKLVIDSSYANAIEAFSVIEQSIEEYKIEDEDRIKQKKLIESCLKKVEIEKVALLKELLKVYEQK